ncbi:glyoxalase [Tenacibaculum sp. AHE15PA]|uniref:glyoxalase n=1 Tax=unclassified Tenacibaculum TaxID=2635139 RepID=UPI001C4F995B|nr:MULTISPECIES: glyoxalase [unclassified Tenacibaculum]QXP74559.1 glyoxalase [Tenacibaculum sp. AHE14PA]QXP76070.1 glyoxalase [Tenacibaculum sp. AHE15PA]
MDSNKISIRPVLNLSSEIPVEDFQNKTIRPILKLQHELLLQFFVFFCKNQKVDILNVEKEKFNKAVNNITKKNINLKNQFLGLIIGQFTVGEFEFYKENNTDINKRILTMIGQRIKDSQLEIKDFKTNNNDNRTKN